MNKTAIRNFAIWARNKLIADVSYKAGLMGITSKGIFDALSQSTLDVEFYDIGTAEPYAIRAEEIKQRKGLVDIIRQKEKESDYATAYSSVIEEVAYTWFNRLIAVRFMEINDYMPAHIRVLSSETGKLEPDIVTTPFDVELELTDVEKQQIIELKNDNKLDECFKMLFIKQCNALHSMLPRLFENTSDYSELLLNVSFVDQDGVIYHLVHDIEEDDFNIEKGGQVEIIGWLYQYYNSELKDETFALLKNNVKVTKERIPSATQLFTPDWIVRYMVENSLGRFWIEGHPNDSLKSGWKYYLDEAEQEADVKAQLDEIKKEYAKLTPEDIKVIDPCMGSGHILVYAFDVLMQIYESAGYTQRDAAKSILENNLFGLDIDERAAQLAYFAVLMKARQYNRRILNDYVTCNVYAIRESNGIDRDALNILCEAKNIGEKLVDTFIDAKEYGSILNVDITADELVLLDSKLDELKNKTSFSDVFEAANSEVVFNRVVPLMLQAKLMVQKYDAVITNPPYMNASGMEDKLSDYVKSNYINQKADLYSCCMEKAFELANPFGMIAMITMETWMFLSSMEKFRNEIISQETVLSLVHMPYLGKGGTSLGINFGTSAFIFLNNNLSRYLAEYNYIRYYELNDCLIPKEFPMNNERHTWKNLEKYKAIPGSPISYWVSDKLCDSFKNEKIDKYAISDGQTKTGDNTKYLRCLWEVQNDYIGKGKKWVLIAKGGIFRRWYGNIEYVIDWSDVARNHFRKDKVARIAPEYIWFREGVSWNHVTSNEKFAARLLKDDMLFETAAPSVFFDERDRLILVIAYLNSIVSERILKLINPTMCTNVGDVTSQPFFAYEDERKFMITELAEGSIDLSREDWDSFETSWDFKRHPLI